MFVSKSYIRPLGWIAAGWNVQVRCYRILAVALVQAGTVWCAAHANNTVSDYAKLLDRPLARQEIAAGKSKLEPDGITCTWYSDFMVRETGSDSPAPGPSRLLRVEAGNRRPACEEAPSSASVKLTDGGFGLAGRKGPFLFFDLIDGNGAEDFLILHAPDGKSIYSDSYGVSPDQEIQEVSLLGGLLHLRYTRGYNGSCSLPKDGAACWAKLIKEGHFAHAVAAEPPPLAACKAAYAGSKSTADNPSMILYDVEIDIAESGKAKVQRRGPLGCVPMP